MKYGFFPGCAYQTAAGYKESVDQVNRRIGVRLEEISDWNCCGATAAFSMDAANGLALAGRVLALAHAQGYQEVVTVCNACYATLQKAVSVFGDAPDAKEDVNRRLKRENLSLTRVPPVRHYMDVLIEDVPEAVWLDAAAQSPLGKTSVAVYYGCQLTRPYGAPEESQRPRRLEAFFQRLGLRPVAHSAQTLCCGASHLVPHEKDCIPLIARIIQEMTRKGAALVTTICPMCQFNLDYGQSKVRGAGLPVTYFTQVIGLAMGMSPKDLGMDKLLIPLKREPEVDQ